MANRAYLCCCNLRRTYPSFRNERYRPERDTVASATYTIPLLWLGLFGPADLRTDRILDDEGDDVGTPAPLVTKREALARLPKAIPRLERALPKLGPLGDRAEALATALRKSKGLFVTIELEEIAMMESSPSRFYERLRKALAHVAGGKQPNPGKLLAGISEIDSKRPLSVLGSSHIRPVPWETVESKAKVRLPPKQKPEVLLEEAIAAGDEACAEQIIAQGADLNMRRLGAETPMQQVIHGYVRKAFARVLVDAGYDLSKKHGGYNALHSAIWVDNAEMARELLRLGAGLREKDGFGRTPLALAAFAGSARCIDVLVRAGLGPADIDGAIRVAEKRLSTSGASAGAKKTQAALGLLRKVSSRSRAASHRSSAST